MNLLIDIDKEVLQLIKEAESSTLDEKVAEWRDIKKQQSVLAKVTKMMSSRISELEAEMLPIVKHMENQQSVVDSAIIEFKSRKTKGVKYQKAFEKALEIVNKDQKQILLEFLDSVTSKGVNEKVAIVDPELESFMSELKEIEPDEIVQKLGRIANFPRQIKNKKKREARQQNEGIVDNAKLAIKSLVNAIKSAFSKVKSLISKSDKHINELSNIAKQEM